MVDHGSLAAQSGFPPLVATMLLATLLKLLAGLIEPVCGAVTINDGGCRIYTGQPMEGRQAGVCASGIHGAQRNLARQYHAAPSVADG